MPPPLPPAGGMEFIILSNLIVSNCIQYVTVLDKNFLLQGTTLQETRVFVMPKEALTSPIFFFYRLPFAHHLPLYLRGNVVDVSELLRAIFCGRFVATKRSRFYWSEQCVCFPNEFSTT